MEQNQSGTRFLKKGRVGKNKKKELNCVIHPKKQYTRLCKKCLVLLCDKCLLANEHVTCDVISVNPESDSVYNQLKTRLSDRIKDMRSGVFELHEVLVRKKERMLKKRNETVAEIERYFNKVKEKILKDLNNKERDLSNELKTSVGEQETILSEHIGQCNRLRHNLSETITMLDNLDRLYQNTDKNNGDHIQQLHQVSRTLNDHDKNIKAVESTRDSFLVIRFIVNPDGERSILNKKLASVEVLNSRNRNSDGMNRERSAIESAENRRSPVAEGIARSNARHGLTVELPDETVYPQNRRSRSAPRLRPRSEIHFDRERPSDEARNLLTVPKSNSTNSFLDIDQDDDSNTRNTHGRNMFGELPNRRLQTSRHRNSPSPTHMRGNNRTRERRSPRHSPVTSSVSEDHNLIDFESTMEAPTTGQRSSPPTTSIDTLLDSPVDTVESPANLVPLENTAISDTAIQGEEGHINAEVENSFNDDIEAGHSSGSEKLPLEDAEASTVSDDPPPPYPGVQRPVTPPAPGELPPPYQDDALPPPYVQYPETSQQSVGQPRRRLYGYSGDTRRKETSRINAPVARVVLNQSSLETENTNSNYRTVKAIGPITTFTVSEVCDRRSPGMFALLYHNENSFLIVDRWNKKLKYFNDSGVSYGGVIFREEPWDITKVNTSQYAVTVPQLKSIFKLEATDDNIKATGVICTERKYACVAYHAQSERYVCGQVPQFGEPVIDLIGNDGGPILMSFKSDNSGISLFSYPRYVKVSRDGVIVVCDWNMKCLLLLKLDGTFIGKYKGSGDSLFTDPTGIVINQATDTIYAIASKCESVHKISLNCELLEVFGGPEEFRDARAIDSNGDRIAIGCKNGLVNVFATSAQSHRV